MKKISLIALIALFGILFITSCTSKSEYELKLDKKSYAPGETIKVEFTANPEWDEYAWIGIIPSDVAHGKESTNDENDFTYQYLNNKASGTLEFIAPSESGKYDFRMNDMDDSENGVEIASISFEVK